MLRLLRKILIAILAAMALGLWLTVAVLWIRSYWRGDLIVIRRNVDLGNNSPRLRIRTFALASGKGGLALAIRQTYTDWVIARVDRLEWNVFEAPAYPGAVSIFGAVGGLSLEDVAMVPSSSPTTAPARIDISYADGADLEFSGASGSHVSLSINGAPPSTFPAGTVIHTGTSIGSAVFPARQTEMMFPGGGGVIGQRLWIDPAGQTMATTLGQAGIPPPPNPPAMPRRFYAYHVRVPLSPATSQGDLSGVIILPHWAVLAPLTVPLLLIVRAGIVALRARHRAREGRCAQCGYDLRATPERCPECGLATTGHSP